MSIPDQRWTVHFTWSPGATSCPLLLGGKDSPGWEKAENKFSATSGLPACVCVCPVWPPYMHVCVSVFVCVCVYVCECFSCYMRNWKSAFLLAHYINVKETKQGKQRKQTC